MGQRGEYYMKYLWVEDFDGNMNRKTNEAYWMTYFSLEEENVILKTNLAEALEVITNEPNSFDAVLLDISLVNSNNDKIYTKKHWDTWYEDYFQGYIDKDYYNDESHRRNGTGILLYLYLRERYHFPKERICFISAYAGNESGEGTKEYNTLKNSMTQLGCQLGMAREKPPTRKASSTTSEKPKRINPNLQLSIVPEEDQDTVEIKGFDEVFLEEFIGQNDTEYVKYRRFLLDASNMILSHYNSLSSDSEKDTFVRVRHKNYFQLKSNGLIKSGYETYDKEYFIQLIERFSLYPLHTTSKEQETQTMLAMLESLIFFAESIIEPIDPLSHLGKKDMYTLCLATQEKQKSQQCNKDNKVPYTNQAGLKGAACGIDSDSCVYSLNFFERANIALLKKVRNSLSHGAGFSKETYLHAKELVACAAFRTIFDMRSVEGYDKLEQDFLNVTDLTSIQNLTSEMQEINVKLFTSQSFTEGKNIAFQKQLQFLLKSREEIFNSKQDLPGYLYHYYFTYFVDTAFILNYNKGKNLLEFTPKIEPINLNYYLKDKNPVERTILLYVYQLFQEWQNSLPQ